MITCHVYRLQFRGVASNLVQAEFDDVEVSESDGSTILQTDPIDSAALYGLIRRIESLGLALVTVETGDMGSTGVAAVS